MLEEIKKIVWEQNRRLPASGLVILTEGNVSQISPDRKFMVIKPSGVSYDDLVPQMMVVVDIETGNVVEGDLRPSTDTPTHIEIYKHLSRVGGITHTHSPYATMFAQQEESIPCYGTTHADAFSVHIPVTRSLTEEEINEDYERHTGRAITELLQGNNTACVLVARHGPFAVGASPKESVDHAMILEKIAMMAVLGKPKTPISDVLLKKHHERKHGKDKYYGQDHLLRRS